jgi:hypothetical protein
MIAGRVNAAEVREVWGANGGIDLKHDLAVGQAGGRHQQQQRT